MDPSRRTVLRATAAGLGVLGAAGLGACSVVGSGPGRVALATGGPTGVYRHLGDALAGIWRTDLGVGAEVLGSEGSVDNVALLTGDRADVAFCAADVAATAAAATGGAAPGDAVVALARMHDDALHVVVPADSPIRRLADLRGRRVSVGAPSSGVLVVAPRLLETVGLAAGRDLEAVQLGLGASVDALLEGRIDAFFWSGGVPTAGVDALAGRRRIRLLDLSEEIAPLRRTYPVYDVTTVPVRTYGIPEAVTTASVRNVLLVTSAMPDDRAEGLTRVLLDRRQSLAAADAAGRNIDPRTAIGTQPVPLHPGAARAYRRLKGT